MNDTQNQSGFVDPLAQMIVDAANKLGGRAWLGFPLHEEREILKVEKAERDAQCFKHRMETNDRKRAELKERTLAVFQRNRDEQG